MDDDWDDYYVRRPRMQLATGTVDEDEDSSYSPSKFHIGFFGVVGIAFLGSAFFTFDLLQALLVWIGVSFLVGPHFPVSLTYGDCRVGLGEELPDPEPDEESEDQNQDVKLQKRGRGKFSSLKVSSSEPDFISETTETKDQSLKKDGYQVKSAAVTTTKDEPENSDGEWSAVEMERLKKGLVKFPRGTPRRWEHVTKFIEARKSMEDVIAMAKLLSEKPAERDDYAKFLADRKSSKPISSELTQNLDSQSVGASNGKEEPNWTESEDFALIKALKEFGKDTPLRWEKVSISLSSKSKQQCIKRFSDLKQTFKSSKNKIGPDLSSIE